MGASLQRGGAESDPWVVVQAFAPCEGQGVPLGGGNKKPIKSCLSDQQLFGNIIIHLRMSLASNSAFKFPATSSENTSRESNFVKSSPLIQCSFRRGPHRLLLPPPNPLPAALPPSAAALLQTAVRGPPLQWLPLPSPRTLCGRYACLSSSPPLLVTQLEGPPHPPPVTSGGRT